MCDRDFTFTCLLHSAVESCTLGDLDCKCGGECTPSWAHTERECSLSYRGSQAALFAMKNALALSVSAFCISEPHLTWHCRPAWCHLLFLYVCVWAVTGGSATCLPTVVPISEREGLFIFGDFRQPYVDILLLENSDKVNNITQFRRLTLVLSSSFPTGCPAPHVSHPAWWK